MQAKHVWAFYFRSMKPLAQRVIGLELVMNGHLMAKRKRRVVLAFQSGLFSWTELAVDFKPPTCCHWCLRMSCCWNNRPMPSRVERHGDGYRVCKAACRS